MIHPKISPAPLISLFTAEPRPNRPDGGRLTKSFHQDGGKIRKTTAALMTRGQVDILPISTAAELAATLDDLTPYQAAGIGVLADGRTSAKLVTKATKERSPADGLAARSLADFRFPEAPGWLLIDFDDKGAPPEALARIEELGGVANALWHIWPEGKDAAHVIRGSSSDGVSADGVETLHSRGAHIFVLVDNISRAREALDTLMARAWREGLGWIAFAANGNTLQRGLIDVAVGSPERLIFEAAPILGEGVTRTPRPSIVSEGPAAAIPQDGEGLFAVAAKAQKRAEHAARPEAAKVADNWVNARAEEDVRLNGVSIEKARQRARAVLKRQGGRLFDDDILPIGFGQWITVGEILDNPDKWHGRGIPDPIEGPEYGATTATLLLKPRPGHPDEKPRLVSHAHGQRNIWTFERAENPPPERIAPFHPAPTLSREAAKRAHPETVQGWGRTAIPMARARKEVMREYEALDVEYPDLSPSEKRKRQTEIREAVQTKFGLDFLPASQWSRMAQDAPRELLRGAQGVGKSEAAIDVLTRAYGLVSLVLLPTVAMAEELAERYGRKASNASPRWAVLRGRGKEAPEGPETAPGETMCRTPEQAAKVAERALGVKGTLCNACPHFSECKYIKQEKRIAALADDRRGVVIFAAHEYAFIPLPRQIIADLTIFDEAPRGNGVDERAMKNRALTFEELGQQIEFDGAPYATSAVGQAAGAADALAANFQFIQPLKIAIRNAAAEQPAAMLAHLRAAGIDRERVESALKGLNDFQDIKTAQAIEAASAQHMFAGLSGGRRKAWATLLDEALANAIPKTVPRLKLLFAALLDEINNPGDALTSVFRSKRGREVVEVATIKRLEHGNKSPFLHLDGTADPIAAQAVFGDLKDNHFPIERNAEVTLITGRSFAKTGILGRTGNRIFDGPRGEESRQLREDLKGAIARYPGAAVFSNKPVIEALGLADDPMAGHFGNIRGRNTWEDASAVIILGREEPPIEAVERIARAYSAKIRHDFKPAPEYVKETRGARLANGTGHPVTVRCHPDPIGDLVLRMLRDAEIEQAIDRARLIHNRAPKQVFILAEVAPDVTMHNVVKWLDFKEGGSRIQRAIDDAKVIPLNGRECARLLPGIWSSETTAKRDLRAGEISGPNSKRYILFGKWPTYFVTHVSYQVSVSKQKKSPKDAQKRKARVDTRQALVFAPPSEARAKLEALTGPVEAFEVIEHCAPVVETVTAQEDQAERWAEFEELAAKAEFDHGLSRLEAERWALERMTPHKETQFIEPPPVSRSAGPPSERKAS